MRHHERSRSTWRHAHPQGVPIPGPAVPDTGAISPGIKSLVALGRNIMSEPEPPAKQRFRPTGNRIIAAILIIAALLFTFRNTHASDFRFL